MGKRVPSRSRVPPTPLPTWVCPPPSRLGLAGHCPLCLSEPPLSRGQWGAQVLGEDWVGVFTLLSLERVSCHRPLPSSFPPC